MPVSSLFMLTGAAPTALRKRRIPMQDSENPAWGCHIIRAALLTGQSVDHIAKAFEHLVHRSVAVHAGILASLRIVLGDHLGLRTVDIDTVAYDLLRGIVGTSRATVCGRPAPARVRPYRSSCRPQAPFGRALYRRPRPAPWCAGIRRRSNPRPCATPYNRGSCPRRYRLAPALRARYNPPCCDPVPSYERSPSV